MSVINYPTYKAIADIQSLHLIPTKSNVRAADGLIIPFKGLCTIKFSLDMEGKYVFEHNFWVAAEEKSCEANLIGMEWIQSHCTDMNFEDNTIKLRNHKNVMIHLAKNVKQKFPFFHKTIRNITQKNPPKFLTYGTSNKMPTDKTYSNTKRN